jgi:hypothetical protein
MTAGKVKARLGLVAAGCGLAVIVFVGNVVASYIGLSGCRAENATHIPAACPLIDDSPDALFALLVVGSALLLPVLGAFGMSVSRLVAVGGLIWGLWVAYLALLAIT